MILAEAKGKYIWQVTSVVPFHNSLCSFGFVAYSTVEEAKQVVDSSDEIELDGHILHIDFSRRGEN